MRYLRVHTHVAVALVVASFGVTASASRGKGQGNGAETSHNNTHISGARVNIQSGADTTLQGTVVQGEQVSVNTGGNLHIQSLQDSASYHERSSNVGGSITVGAGFSGSFSAGKTKVDSDYQSVTEQSGIRAGDGGFQVTVAGDTTLNGGAITSSDAAVNNNLNRFETDGTLSTSDIQNSASYNASSASIGIGTTGGSAGIGSDKGNAASTTQAAISGIAGNTDARTGDAETGIKAIFDKERVKQDINAQVQITQAFGEQASRAWGMHANQKFNDALQAGDEEGMRCWGPDGACRAGGHAVLGGLTGGVGGAAGAGLSSVAAPHVQAFLLDQGLPPPAATALTQLAAIGAGAAVGGAGGAVAGQNEAGNNAVALVIPLAELVTAGGALAARTCLTSPACLNALRLGGVAVVAKVASLIPPEELAKIPGFGAGTQPTPVGPLVTPMPDPSRMQEIYGSPPLNDAEQLRAWLGNALQGYPADEAQKWAQDLIRTLPAAEQQHYSDLIVQQVHHICTDKNCVSPNTGGPWTPEFRKMFDKAGVSMQDELNKVWVAGHQGPHPQEYHEAVFQRLKDLESLPPDAYQQAFKDELAKIGKEIQTPGTRLNKLVTKQ